MPENRPGILRRLFGGLWRVVDVTRRVVLNLLFLLVLLLLAAAFFAGSGRQHILDDTALVIDIKGEVVEQYTGSAREAEFAQAFNGEAKETQLRDLLEVLDAAAKDPKIARVVLILDDMGGAGIAKLRELAAALERFKATGKQVIAWGSSLDQHQYFLAAHASEAYLHPYGEVALSGFGGFRGYYHDALERLGVTINVFRVGKFKSAVEPLIDNGPSKEAAEADAFWLGDAWAGYTQEIEAARHLPAGAVAALIAQAPARLAANGGDAARFALEEKLVDGLKTRDELRALMLERGQPDDARKTFRQVSFDDYRATLGEHGDRSRQVGVIVAAGLITDGVEAQGRIGGRSTSDLIRAAREDDAVKAVVLRIDSGGGSVFGSELIRREIELLHRAGKPVVVSMSDVAASGGYWITTPADRVLADPATITGSIGVFGVFPTADRGLEKLGIHTGGATTTWRAGAEDIRRPLDGRLAAVMQRSVEHVYKEFLDHVASARKLAPERVDEIAQGRVWTGRQAQERGLIDEMGGLESATTAAATLAQLKPGYRVTYLEGEAKGWNRIIGALPGAGLRTALYDVLAQGFGLKLARAVTDTETRDLGGVLANLRQGNMTVFAHCLCAAP